MATATMTASRTVSAKVNYFPIDGARIAYPGTAGYQRRELDPRVVQISDVRGREKEFKLDVNGFQVIKHDLPDVRVDATDAEVKQAIYSETIKVVKQLYVVG